MRGEKMRVTLSPKLSKGFTLLETMIALVVLAVGILGLAAMLGNSLAYLHASQIDYIAQQKASEAIESIYTARQTGGLTWATIQNTTTPPGVFLVGPQQLVDPGPDGIVGTADDNLGNPDVLLQPGPDGILGTADDIRVPLADFNMTRTITIAPVAGAVGLRSISIVINYQVGRITKQYTMNSYISQFR